MERKKGLGRGGRRMTRVESKWERTGKKERERERTVEWGERKRKGIFRSLKF